MDKQSKATTSYEIQTHSEATKVSATVLPSSNNNGGLFHLLINIVDAKGIRVLNYRKDVKCEVISGGKLLGLENANNSDMSAPKQPHKNANRGRLLAYIMRNNPTQKVKVRITAEDLSPIDVEI